MQRLILDKQSCNPFAGSGYWGANTQVNKTRMTLKNDHTRIEKFAARTAFEEQMFNVRHYFNTKDRLKVKCRVCNQLDRHYMTCSNYSDTHLCRACAMFKKGKDILNTIDCKDLFGRGDSDPHDCSRTYQHCALPIYLPMTLDDWVIAMYKEIDTFNYLTKTDYILENCFFNKNYVPCIVKKNFLFQIGGTPKTKRIYNFFDFARLAAKLVDNRYTWFEFDNDKMDKTMKIITDNYQNIMYMGDKHQDWLQTIVYDGFIMEGKSDIIQKANKGLSLDDNEFDVFIRANFSSCKNDMYDSYEMSIPPHAIKAFCALGYLIAYGQDRPEGEESSVILDRSFLSHTAFESCIVDYRAFLINLASCFSDRFSYTIIVLNHVEDETGHIKVPWPIHNHRAMEQKLYKSKEELIANTITFYYKIKDLAKNFYYECLFD
jgi:hypothetical protein